MQILPGYDLGYASKESSAPIISAYRCPAVRELAWVLSSPPLLTPTDADVRWLDAAWSTQAWQSSQRWLNALDAEPAPLLTALAQSRDQRLGSRFENLLGFWLAWPENPLYRLIHRRLAIRVNGITLGELDFLVEDRRSGELQHWEVAVKFYLGIQAGGQHQHWIGPEARDRLDLKLTHLRQHQLPLMATPAGKQRLQQLDLPSTQAVCLLKGRLFYPPQHTQAWAPEDAAPNHPRGWWQSRQDFLSSHASDTLHWMRLPKHLWLHPAISPVLIGDALSADALIETLLQSPDNRAIAVIGFHNNHEVSRGFITPLQWPHYAIT